MSALSFKITTDTAKINNFRKSLERLYELLEKFPSKSSGFKVINRHISDLETRVDQAIRKIAKMQQQAAESAAKVATPATPTATPSNSKTTSGSQTAQAEAAAYKDLIGTIREASAQKKIYTAQIELLKTKTQALTAEYNALSKAEKNNAAVSQAQKDKRLDLSLSIAKNKEELALYQGTLKNIIKTEQFAEGSINKMSQSLTRMKNIYRNLSAAEREGTRGQTMLKNIDTLDTKIKELDAAMGVHTRNVGNYASGFNMLGFQIQQVARELPSLAYGPQIFFSAISNNLPMLADEISHAKKSVDELKKAGQTFTPVWKQIASSIFSWQTLLVAGVTVLTLYGKEITSWVSNLFAADKSLDSVIKNIDQFNNQVTTSREELQREFRALSQAKKGTAEYALARQTIMDKYDKYLSKQRAEIQNLEDMRGAYEVLLRSVTATSVAKGLEEANANAATEYSEALNKAFEGVQAKFIAKFGKETGITYFTRFREGLQSGVPELEKEALEIYKMFEGAPDGMNVIDTWKEIFTGKAIGTTTHNALENSFNSAREATMRYNETLSANKVAMQALLDMYNISAEDIDKDGKATEDIVEQKKKEIAEIEKIVAKTPEEVAARNKKLETARKELKALENLGLATKEQIELDNTRKQIQREMRDAGFEARQAEIDVMPEGIDKNIAQIELDYQKREAAIADGAERIRELQKKELSRGQRELIAARQQAIKALKNEEWDTAFLAEAGIKDPKTYLDDQLEAWNEYYMKYGTILEKIQATKDYYDREIEKATTLGDKEKLKKEREAAIAQIKTKESQDWIAFFSWIETMSKNMASNIYNTLREQLNQMLQTGKISIENYIQATQKLDQQYREKLNERSRFQTLQDSGINGLIDKYQKLGDAMQLKGAKTGDQNIQAMGASMSKAAGNASGVVSMIDMIVTSIHQTIQAIQLLTDSIVEMMASFGQDAEIDTALGKWAELSNMLSEFDNHVYASWEKFKSGDMMGAAAEATSSVFGVITSINKWIDKSKERKIQKIQDQVDALQDSYDKLSRSISKAYSTDAKELIEDQNKLLEQQKILIQRQIEEEKSKKDPDKKRIKEWQKQIDEITNTIEDNAAKAQDAIFGADIQSAINDFAEAYAEAWTKGENRAKSSKDFVKNIIKQMVIEAMKADIKTPLQTIRDKLEEFWKDGIIDQTEENVINEMIDKLNQDLEASFSWADKYFEDGKTKQEATSRGFQAMSQDTGDELNGRFTDIQGKVTDIRGYVMAMAQTGGIITAINNIATLGDRIDQMSVACYESLRFDAETLIEVREINSSTKNMDKTLARIEEGINSIKKNTESL